MATQVLLIEDEEHLGRSGDIVSVREGYARNYLLPRRIAVVADAATMRLQAKLQEKRQKQAEADRGESEAIKARLEGVVLEREVKVDHDGHMYGSVNLHDVLELLLAATGIEFEKRALQLKHAIKEVGVYELPIKLKEGVMASVQLKVFPEAQPE